MPVCQRCGIEKERSEFTAQRDWSVTCNPCKIVARRARSARRRPTQESNPAWKRAHSRAVMASNRRYPERCRARLRLFYAVSTGKLHRAPCFCGETKVEGHHPDYSEPLKVEWLCNKHHREADAALAQARMIDNRISSHGDGDSFS